MASRSLSQENTRVAIYARVSTKDKGQEVENQLRQLREFSSSQRWVVYREFVDHETGSTDDRTAFQAMFKDASQRKFDLLLFWALDRLSPPRRCAGNSSTSKSTDLLRSWLS